MTAAVALLHSPFVGGGSWAPVAARLPHAIVVDYSHVLGGAPPFYAAIANAVAQQLAAQDDIVLVAHSGAGALIPAITCALGPRSKMVIFADALLPHPARCWFDTLPRALHAHLVGLADNGCLPPWDKWWPQSAMQSLLPDPKIHRTFVRELRKTPLSYCNEIAPDIPLPPEVRAAYLQLSAACAPDADEAEAKGWPVKRLNLHHLGMLTDSEEVANGLSHLLSAYA